jgi:L-amino acid N-acyltransferase YncA
MQFLIRPAKIGDGPQIASIYNYYILNTVITFEEEVVSDSEMAERVVDGASIGSWLVAEVDGSLVGYTYAAPFAARSGYRKSAEFSGLCVKKSSSTGVRDETIFCSH